MTYPLDPQEYRCAIAHIENLNADLRNEQSKATNLHNIMAKFQSNLDAQQAIIDRINEKLFLAKAVVAPIRRLPFEVLGEVVCYVALDPNATLVTLRDLSRICRAWRHAAMNTPMAWTNIRLTCVGHGLYFRRYAFRVDHAREWFSRAGTCEKDVTITGGIGSKDDLVQLNQFLDLVIRASSTIRSLHIDCVTDSTIPISRIAHCLSHQLPLLQSLCTPDLRSTVVSPLGTFTVEPIQLGHTPRLSTWYGEYQSFDLPLVVQRQLRHVGITYFQPFSFNGTRCATLSDVLGAMQTSGVLQQLLSLSLMSERSNETIDFINKECAQADSLLSLALSGRKTLETFFEHLRVPNLRRLLIRCLDPNALSKASAANCINYLVSSSNPPLRALYLHALSLPDADLLSALRRLPYLNTFVVQDVKASNRVMEALSQSDYMDGKVFVGWLCPRLQRISICCKESRNDKFRITRSAVERFVTARLDAYDKEPLLMSTPRLQERLQEVRHEWFILQGIDRTGGETSRKEWEWKATVQASYEEGPWWDTTKQAVWWIKQGAVDI